MFLKKISTRKDLNIDLNFNERALIIKDSMNKFG